MINQQKSTLRKQLKAKKTPSGSVIPLTPYLVEILKVHDTTKRDGVPNGLTDRIVENRLNGKAKVGRRAHLEYFLGDLS